MPAENDTPDAITYRVVKQYEALYYVFASDEDRRVASVGRFMPGPMVHVNAPSITPPAMAQAIARAMVRCAKDLHDAR